jgi:hypothetical protein
MVEIPTPTQITSDPQLFASKFLKILDKEKNLVSFRWNRIQKHYHVHRTKRDLILKYRQGGISTYIQGEIFRRAVTKTTTSISLTHHGDLTDKFRMMNDRFYDNCRMGNIQPERKYANASLTTYPEFNSSCVIATAGNVSVGRGDTYTDLHGSEVAFWPDAKSILSGAMQGGNPNITLESTPNGAMGYFYELCNEAMHIVGGIWKLHFYPWWWDDTYKMLASETSEKFTNPKLEDDEKELIAKHNLSFEQIIWRRYKQAELKEEFLQEYPEDPATCFLTSGNSYFFTGVPLSKINKIFSAPLDAQYIEGHDYYAGLDWGQSADFTAMPILDATEKRQVALLHINKLQWKEMRKRIKSEYGRWHIKALGCEMNSIGSVNFEALHDDGLNVIPFDTTNETKGDIMSDLYEAIHTNGWKLRDDPVLNHEMHNFVSVQLPSGIWRLQASGEGHDDTVMGLAIAKWTVLASKMQIF